MQRIGSLVVVGLLALALGVFWSRWPESDPVVLWERARESSEARDWPAVEAALTRLDQVQGLNGEQGILLAEAHQWLDQTDQAIQALTAVPRDDPLAARSRLLAGQVELRRRRLPAAEHWLREALRIDGSMIQARRELIYIYGMQLRRGEMDSQFRRLAEQTTLDADQIFLWCLSRSVRWKATDLVVDLKRFLEADPNDRWSRLALADSLFGANQLDEAWATLEPLAEDDPEALAHRAEVALARDGHQAAAGLLAKGPPESPALAKLRGRLALFDRDAETAAHQFEIAHEAAPQDREALNGLATALRMLGRLEEANQAQTQAERLDQANTLLQQVASEKSRDSVNLWVQLGLVYRDAGLRPQARAWLRLALSREPENRVVRQALLTLESEPEPSLRNWSAQTDPETR